MDMNVYKHLELTGTSNKSIEDAVNHAIEKASQSIRNLRWFTVEEIRGTLNESKVEIWQVNVKVGFTIE